MAEYDFGSGTTNPETFPVDALAEAAARAVRNVGTALTRYPGLLGHQGLRELMAKRELEREGVAISPDHIALMNGSMQAVTLVAEALMTGDDDMVVTEELTYVGTISAYNRLGLEMLGQPLDAHGMRMDALEQTLAKLADQDRKPRFIYTLASYQNPTGTVMPRERRLELIEIARRYDVPVVEDNCYGDVHFEGDKPPALYALDDSPSQIYICSLSKIFGPGVRLGYLFARPPMLEQLLARRHDAGNSLLAASIVHEFLRDNLWEHTEFANKALKEKRDAVLNGLAEHLGNICTWSEPVGGLFIWVGLPDDVDLDRLFELAADKKVGFARGARFHVRGEDVQNIRLAFGHPKLDEIHEGMRLLAECIRDARRAPTSASAS